MLRTGTQVTPAVLVPTFPIDHNRIRQRRYLAILTQPRLFLARLRASVAKAAESTRGKHDSFVQSSLATWKDLDEQLTEKIVRELVSSSNHAQDLLMESMIHRLQAFSHVEYAATLADFLALKKNVERKLHARGPLTLRKEEIERLVDSVCQEICNEIARLTSAKSRMPSILTGGKSQQLDRLHRTMQAGHKRILEAYATLSETAINLREAYEVVPQTEAQELTAEENTTLDRLLEVLRDENESNRNADQRIRTELPRMDH